MTFEQFTSLEKKIKTKEPEMNVEGREVIETQDPDYGYILPDTEIEKNKEVLKKQIEELKGKIGQIIDKGEKGE